MGGGGGEHGGVRGSRGRGGEEKLREFSLLESIIREVQLKVFIKSIFSFHLTSFIFFFKYHNLPKKFS